MGLWWRLCRWLSSPVWQIRERAHYDRDGWAFARSAKEAWTKAEQEAKAVHDSWIAYERSSRGMTAVEIARLKGREEGIRWMMGLVDENPDSRA
jgi:hypothetical protein